MIQHDDHRLVWLSPDKATTPGDGELHCYLNRWWVTDGDGRIAFYRPTPKSKVFAPQCNPDEGIAKSIRDRLYPWALVARVPVVFVPLRHGEVAL